MNDKERKQVTDRMKDLKMVDKSVSLKKRGQILEYPHVYFGRQETGFSLRYTRLTPLSQTRVLANADHLTRCCLIWLS
uniref:Uncharacterized protein n=1 Tax=Arundo donax TaxID=35708 RepID=A0A0A9BPJ4_ARUDO